MFMYNANFSSLWSCPFVPFLLGNASQYKYLVLPGLSGAYPKAAAATAACC